MSIYIHKYICKTTLSSVFYLSCDFFIKVTDDYFSSSVTEIVQILHRITLNTNILNFLISHWNKVVCVWWELPVYLECDLVMLEDVLEAGHVICVPLPISSDGRH